VNDQSGTDIGRYRLIAKLGEGGMGAVYLAEHTLMRKRVAVKVMRAEIAARPDLLNRFVNEARAAARIVHPGIVQVFDCALDQKAGAYMAMELLRGEGLGSFMNRHPSLSGHPTQLRRIGRDIALAVGAAHAAGVIHRDLKPDNVFLSVARADKPSLVEVKVLDFGIAKLASKLDRAQGGITHTGAVIGTPLYMAPEQFVAAKDVDGRADIYSLGCILYQLATGKTPPRLREIAPGVDESFDALVMKLLDDDPDQRPADMDLVAAALAEGLTPESMNGPIILPPELALVPFEPAEHGPRDIERAAAPTLKPEDALPAPPTSFVGREREIAEAGRLFGRTSLLTLTGPGGSGKTRLALKFAATVADRFPDGVTFVPLAAITDPELVAPAIVESLHLETSQIPARERLLRHLRDRRALLVLDNLEQLLGAAPLIAELIRGCPSIKVIVSSRAPLRISGEQEMPVPPLQLPGAGAPFEQISRSEAVRLFTARAMATTPSFELTSENASAVLQICERLDGLPLAIELAAARIKYLPPAAILGRLQTRLGLYSVTRDVPERQRTLRATIEWSYDLLDQSSKRLFAFLAAFGGGAALEDLEAVCGGEPSDLDVLEALTTLVDHSLVQLQDSPDGSRAMMLETIRELALERLAADAGGAAIRERHARHFLALAEEARPHLVRSTRAVWLARLDRELDNLRAAFELFAGSGRIEEALRTVAAVSRFWQFRGHFQEGRRAVERVLADPASKAHPAAREAALEAAGTLAYWLGNLEEMTRHYEEGLALARANGDRARISNALYNLSFQLFWNEALAVDERVRRAQRILGEALSLAREVGDRPGIARCLWAEGVARSNLQGNPQGALPLLSTSIAIFRDLGDLFGLAWALHSQGMARLRVGELAAAEESLLEMISLLGEARDPSGLAIALGDEAQLALARGDRARAIRLAGAAAGLKHLTGAELVSMAIALEGREIQAAPDDAPAWNEGLAMSVDEAVAYALGGRRPAGSAAN